MSYDYPEPQEEAMEPVSNVIDIPPYDYGQEVSNLTEALEKWNARAASRPPFKPTRQPDHPANPPSETSISDWHSQGTSTRRDLWSGLPDNIIRQIISHLYPRDVLALARVDKGTRHKLMSRDSRDLWTSVLQRTHGLPPCPPHMAEPHYVALIFEDTCMGCGLRESAFSSIALGWRLCAPCSWANLVPEYDVKNQFIIALHANDVLNYHIVQEFRVKHVLPYFSVATSEGETRLYYQPEVELFLAECLPIVVRLLHQGDARASAALWAIIRSRGDFVARSHESSRGSNGSDGLPPSSSRSSTGRRCGPTFPQTSRKASSPSTTP
ncbi:hypothetical protein BD413DRAFT_194917 [Trametes elegans]|nr:hypothetical protein BD413DRAFT_194917 [Trametes elegans]